MFIVDAPDQPGPRMPASRESIELAMAQHRLQESQQSQELFFVVLAVVTVGTLLAAFAWQRRSRIKTAAESAAVASLASGISHGRKTRNYWRNLLGRAVEKADRAG